MYLLHVLSFQAGSLVSLLPCPYRFFQAPLSGPVKTLKLSSEADGESGARDGAAAPAVLVEPQTDRGSGTKVLTLFVACFAQCHCGTCGF